LDRSDRIKASHIADAPPAPAEKEDGGRQVSAGVPLVKPKTKGANWRRSLLGRRSS
jgi:hypothetical protein